MKRILNIFITIMLLGIIAGCSNEGELMEEDTYVTRPVSNLSIIGDNDNKFAYYVNGDTIINNYYKEGTDFIIELKDKETKEIKLDTTYTAVFGENFSMVAFYQVEEELIIPIVPIDNEELPRDGYRKMRFMNLIKGDNLLEGRNITLEVYGVYQEGVNEFGYLIPHIVETPSYKIENIRSDQFTSFMEIPELDILSNEAGKELSSTVAKVYDYNSGELLIDAYTEEVIYFPGFPEYGFVTRVVGANNIGGAIINYEISSLQLLSNEYQGVITYNQREVELLSTGGQD